MIALHPDSPRSCERFGERMSRNYRAVRRVEDHSGMAQDFIGCDRDQSFLLPSDVRDWLPEGHQAWFVLDAVAGMNLGEFYRAYREDGVGRRAYDPAMLVALLGHSHLSTTGTYLQGISSEEIISTIYARPAPMMHASAGLAL